MAAIITEKFKQHNANQFFESFSETANNTYYLFLGKSTPYSTGTSGGTDAAPPTPSDSPADEFYIWDDMLAAKKIGTTDITYAIPRRNWTNSIIYDQYEDNINSSNTASSGATNLYSSSFYFMTSDYRVYKVLDNNKGKHLATTSTSTSTITLGGYVLKYMYSLTSTEIEKYLTTDFMPVSTDSTVSAAAVDGSIESLVITGGTGYTDGTFYAAIYGDGTNQGTATGAIVRITIASGAIQGFGVTAGTDTTIHAAGAAYTYGTVNLGTGYTFSDTSLSSASSVGSGSGGVVSVQAGPKGGHGDNAITELGGHYVMMNTTLTQAEGDDFTTKNDFRRVGLVIDPYNYGTTTIASASTRRQTASLKLTSTSGTFDPDEKISQTTTGAIGKVVEWDAVNNILYYQQERFGDYGTSSVGAFIAFSGANAVTGATSNASGTPDASADAAITLAGGGSITFTNGYANPELDPDSGNIIYVENRKPISRASDQTEDIKLIIEF